MIILQYSRVNFVISRESINCTSEICVLSASFIPELFGRLEVGHLFDPIEEREHARVHAGPIGLCIDRLRNEHRRLLCNRCMSRGKAKFTIIHRPPVIMKFVNELIVGATNLSGDQRPMVKSKDFTMAFKKLEGHVLLLVPVPPDA